MITTIAATVLALAATIAQPAAATPAVDAAVECRATDATNMQAVKKDSKKALWAGPEALLVMEDIEGILHNIESAPRGENPLQRALVCATIRDEINFLRKHNLESSHKRAAACNARSQRILNLHRAQCHQPSQ